MSEEQIDDWTDADDADAEVHDSTVDEALVSGDPANKSAASPTRIAEDLAGRVGRWSGVNSCCDSSRALRELQPHFNAWVTATAAAHPGSTVIATGRYAGHIKCKSKRPTGGARKCKGWFTSIVCYVDLV